jgi:hypothetical protein
MVFLGAAASQSAQLLHNLYDVFVLQNVVDADLLRVVLDRAAPDPCAVAAEWIVSMRAPPPRARQPTI